MAPVSIEGCTFYVAIYLFPFFLRALEYFIATDTKRWGMIDSIAIKQGKREKNVRGKEKKVVIPFESCAASFPFAR